MKNKCASMVLPNASSGSPWGKPLGQAFFSKCSSFNSGFINVGQASTRRWYQCMSGAWIGQDKKLESKIEARWK